MAIHIVKSALRHRIYCDHANLDGAAGWAPTNVSLNIFISNNCCHCNISSNSYNSRDSKYKPVAATGNADALVKQINNFAILLFLAADLVSTSLSYVNVSAIFGPAKAQRAYTHVVGTLMPMTS